LAAEGATGAIGAFTASIGVLLGAVAVAVGVIAALAFIIKEVYNSSAEGKLKKA
jgi:hypothetical protein